MRKLLSLSLFLMVFVILSCDTYTRHDNIFDVSKDKSKQAWGRAHSCLAQTACKPVIANGCSIVYESDDRYIVAVREIGGQIK